MRWPLSVHNGFLSVAATLSRISSKCSSIVGDLIEGRQTSSNITTTLEASPWRECIEYETNDYGRLLQNFRDASFTSLLFGTLPRLNADVEKQSGDFLPVISDRGALVVLTGNQMDLLCWVP